MRYIALLFLFAAVFAQTYDVKYEPNPVDPELIEKIKCVINNAEPLCKDIVDIVEAIENKDFFRAIKVILQLVEDGKKMIDTCFPKSTNAGFNFAKLLLCLMRHATKFKEIIEAIQAKDWFRVMKLIGEALSGGDPFIIKCIEEAKS